MQLAYGLFPQGYLPRVVIISDGNQTQGDIAVESYRAQGARRARVVAHVRRGPDRRGPRRRRDHARRHQGRPAVRRDRRGLDAPSRRPSRSRSSRTSFRTGSSRRRSCRCARARTSSSSRARPSARATRRTGCGSRSSSTTPSSKNNAAVMTAPVKGKPSVLYVEGSYQREPSSATYLKRALETENIDVEVRGPGRHPDRTRRSSRSTISCWSPTCPRTSWAPARCSRSTPTSRAWAAA